MIKNTKKESNTKKIKNPSKKQDIKKKSDISKDTNIKKRNDTSKEYDIKRRNDINKGSNTGQGNNNSALSSVLDGLSYSEIQRGMILSEILGKPVSRRNRQRVGR